MRARCNATFSRATGYVCTVAVNDLDSMRQTPVPVPSGGRVIRFLSGAKALLFPIGWSEPVGLVMIEAMACGTPVIAFNRGSVPEVINHGLTGYVCEDVQGAVGALQRLDELSRTEIRAQFVLRFSPRAMAQKYIDSYTSRLQAARRPELRRAAAG